jgi:hypothetical protein
MKGNAVMKENTFECKVENLDSDQWIAIRRQAEGNDIQGGRDAEAEAELADIESKANPYADLIAKIAAHLNSGGRVMIATYTKATVYDKRHVAMFKVGKSGSPLVQRGKHWDDFKWATVRFVD